MAAVHFSLLVQVVCKYTIECVLEIRYPTALSFHKLPQEWKVNSKKRTSHVMKTNGNINETLGLLSHE